MKKIILPLFFTFFCCISVFGQYPTKNSIFHVGFIPPLSTNGREAWDISNTVSFNILGGISAEEKAFTLSGLFTAVRYDIRGFQLAGLFNYAGNSGKGAMIAGLANMVMNDYAGVQLGGIFNWLGYSGTGVQIGGVFNYSRHGYNGVQLGGILNITGSACGVGIGGIGNISGNTNSVQIGGLFNFTDNVEGAQIAGLCNISEKTEAVQIGGVFNIARNTKGFQLGGIFNKAGNINGMQLAGLVNIAKNVKGMQFAALLNVADRSDCPIGLVNIIRHGEMGLAITYNELGSAVLSFRSGGKVTYGIVGIGYNHKAAGTPYVIEGGIGAHINCTRWFRINNELKVSSFTDFRNESDFTAGYSLLPAFRIVRHFEIFGGPSINYMNASNGNASAQLSYDSLWKKRSGNRIKQIYLGWQAGIHVIF